MKIDLTHVVGVKVIAPKPVSDCAYKDEPGKSCNLSCMKDRCTKLKGGKIVFTRYIDLDHDSVTVTFDSTDPMGKGFKWEVEECLRLPTMTHGTRCDDK